MAPIVLIFGPEAYSVGEAIRQIKAQLRSKFPDLEVTEVDASEYSSGHLLNIASPSLFSEPRLVIVDGMEKCTDAFIDDTKSYLDNPAPDTTLVIHHTGSSVRGKSVLEALRASNSVMEILCPKIDKEPERISFVQQQFAAASRQITDGAVRALVQAFSKDIPELAAAADQLLVDSAETITEEIVDRYYGGRMEVDNFKLVDVALSGREGDALYMLRHALSGGVEPIYMLGAISYRIRPMAQIFADRRASAASFGMDNFSFTKAKNSLAGWDDEGLGRVLQALAETDAAAKGASRDPGFKMEQLISLIARKGRDE